MKNGTVVFSHGQESGPWGTKIQAMAASVRAMGLDADSVDYRGIADPLARVDRLVDYCRALAGPPILVGSSMGGYVATAAAARIVTAGVFVLAPAFYMAEFDAPVPVAPNVPMTIVHGWNDEVVPVDSSIRFAAEYRTSLLVVDGDHRLTANIDDINHLLTRFVQQVTGSPS